jgi:hypothetical protein
VQIWLSEMQTLEKESCRLTHVHQEGRKCLTSLASFANPRSRGGIMRAAVKARRAPFARISRSQRMKGLIVSLYEPWSEIWPLTI